MRGSAGAKPPGSNKTECVDPLVPTSGGTWGYLNMLYDADFVYGPPWWTFEGQEVRWVNPGPADARAELYRKNATPPPVIRQPGRDGAIAEDQRVQLTFELRNASATRQRVTVTLQDTGGGAMAYCTFWLAPGPVKTLYAMTTYAASAWVNPEVVVSAATAGTEATHGWLWFDTVTYRRTNRPMLGTECYEPGSFVLDGDGFIVPDEGQAPAPVPAPEPEPDMDALPVAVEADARDDERGRPRSSVLGPRSEEQAGARQHSSDSWLDDITFYPDGAASASGPSADAEPARTDPVTVTLSGVGSGTVTSSPAGIHCAGSTINCTGWFAEGTALTLTATPDSGLTFVGWTGACTGTGTCNVTVVGAQAVTAVFGTPLQFYHLDVLGSVRMITDAAGNVVIRHDYFAFGEDIQGPEGDPRRFTGKERDAETELHYFGARYYRSVWGRFTSVDPHNILAEAESDEELIGFLTDPQNWNRYSYVLNRPQTLTDPDGRCWFCPIVQRYGPPAANAVRQLFNWAARVLGSPTGQEVAHTVAAAMSGYEGPPTGPLSTATALVREAAATMGFRAGWLAVDNMIAGQLKNGATVAMAIARTGDQLEMGVTMLHNMQGQVGLSTTFLGLRDGIRELARANGAKFVSIFAKGVKPEHVETLKRLGFQQQGDDWVLRLSVGGS